MADTSIIKEKTLEIAEQLGKSAYMEYLLRILQFKYEE